MVNDILEERFQKEAEAKAEAIDTYKKEGTFLVLAGPGTGKTYTITHRIKAMIEAGIDQKKILCLTFSDAAARQMKTTLEKYLGTADISVNIFTFHSFCLKVMQDNPEMFPLKDNFNIINESITRTLIKECLDDKELYPQIKAYRDNKNRTYPFIDDIKKGIAEIKRYGIKEDEFFYNLKTHVNWGGLLEKHLELHRKNLEKGEPDSDNLKSNIEKTQLKIDRMGELWKIYKLYLRKMEENNLIDFSDMINMVLDAFKEDPVFCSAIANEYEYILVDEYQDTNKSQNELITALAKAQTKKNVFVVGDDDQIIYTFQGANLETINNFLNEFKDTDKHYLTYNRRSAQDILDVAQQIITHEDNPNRIPKPALTSINMDYEGIKNGVNILPFETIEQEYNYIAESIKTLTEDENRCPKDKDSGEKKFSEIAVLFRTNDEVYEFSKVLRNKGVAVQTSGKLNIFKIPSVVIFLSYLQFLVNPWKYEHRFFEMLLLKPFCIHPIDYEILSALKTNYTVLFDDDMIAKIEDAETKFKDWDKVKKFIDTYKELKELITAEDLKDTLLTIGTKSGIFTEFLVGNSKNSDNIRGLLKVIEEAEAFAMFENVNTLANFVEYMNDSWQDGVKIETGKLDVTFNAVQVITLHDSKGREFEYVYMGNIVPGKCESPSSYNKPKIPTATEDRTETFKEWEDRIKEEYRAEVVRLLYVGMTRAKHSLYLSTTNASKYIQPLIGDTKLIESDDVKNIVSSLMKFDYDDEPAYNALVSSHIKSKSYSTSGLKDYLFCPRYYLLHRVFDLKPRNGNADDLNLGLSVHYAYQKAIEDALDPKNGGEYPSEDKFHEYFMEDISGRVISTRNGQNEFIQKWKEHRSEIYKHLVQYPAKDPVEPEYAFTLNVADVTFGGRVDRVACIEGKYYIHDFKTGKRPKNVEKLKNDYPDYYNQLALYKYIMDRVEIIDPKTGEKKKIKIEDAVLIYPFEEQKELHLNLSEEDCEGVVRLYLETIDKIRDKKFPAEPRNAYMSCGGRCAFNTLCRYYKDKEL